MVDDFDPCNCWVCRDIRMGEYRNGKRLTFSDGSTLRPCGCIRFEAMCPYHELTYSGSLDLYGSSYREGVASDQELEGTFTRKG